MEPVIMSLKRVSLWGRDQYEKYWVDTNRQQQETADRLNGVPVAEDIDAVWKSLTEDERLVIEHLLLSGSPTAVALIEGGAFDGLVEKGMLRRPPGVGTMLIYEHQTTYDVPSAAWQALNQRIDEFIPGDTAERKRKFAETTQQVGESLIVVSPKNRP
jgi:hypothetical protein